MDNFSFDRILRKLLLLIFSLLGVTTTHAQQTNQIEPYQLNLRSLWKKSKDSLNINLLNSGLSQNDSNQVNQTSKPELIFEGYVDTYYALSTDSNSYIPNSIDLYQSVGPRNNQFGLNVARLKTSFSSEKVRGTISMFWGDIPRYSWSTEAPYNNIQEANVRNSFSKKMVVRCRFFYDTRWR